MNEVEATLIVGTVVKWFRGIASRGNTDRGDGSEVVQRDCKGGKATRTLR